MFQVLKEVAAAGWKYFSHASQSAKMSLNEAEQVSLALHLGTAFLISQRKNSLSLTEHVRQVLSRFVRATSMQAKQFDVESITDADLKRQLAYVSFEGMSALSPADYAAFNQAQNTVGYEISFFPLMAHNRVTSIFTVYHLVAFGGFEVELCEP